MAADGETGVTTFDVQRIDRHPRKYVDAGRVGLLHVVRVVPPPKPNPLLLRQLGLAHGVLISNINELPDIDKGWAEYDIRTPGQGIASWSRLEDGVEAFAALLNAGSDPDAYVTALFGK